MPEEKPFEATAARVARAKREGDLPRSQDITGIASLICASLAAMGSFAPLAAAVRRALDDAARSALSPLPYVAIAGCAGTVLCAALSGALLATYAQTRTFTLLAPQPKLERLNPVAGLRRMVSRESAVGGAKALVVAAAVSAFLVPVMRDAFAASGEAAGPALLATIVAQALRSMLAGAVCAAGAFAAADLILERSKWKRRLKMTFDEIKRDHKQSEGDPQQKGRRRQSHRALVRGSIGRLKDAAFVVTNPTHVAVGLEYEPPAIAVPRVIVRAVDDGAHEVKRRARELRIPIVENVALARSLLATTEVGDFIPPGAYGAVAAIVAALVRERRPQ